MITELELLHEQIAVAQAALQLRGLIDSYERMHGEGSYKQFIESLQKSLTPSAS